MAKHLCQATITFGRFYIIQLAIAALDQVRPEEVRFEPLLWRSRWTWLKDKQRWR